MFASCVTLCTCGSSFYQEHGSLPCQQVLMQSALLAAESSIHNRLTMLRFSLE